MHVDSEDRKERVVRALHGHFETLNSLWAEREKEIVGMHVPTPVWHEYKTDCDLRYALGLARWCGQWRLLHSVHDGGEWKSKPVVESSFEYRIEAAEHFDALRVKAIEAGEKSLSKIQEAIEKLKAAA